MAEQRPGICQWCKGRCHLLAHVKDQRLLRLTLDHSQGGRCGGAQRVGCLRRAAGAQWFHHPQRLSFPLKRTGGRGEARWRTITWEQALDEVAERLTAIGGKFGTEAVGLLSGDNWAQFEYGTRFMNLWGSPNYVGPSPICMGPRVNVARAVVGWYPAFSVSPQTRCLVLLGCNTYVGRPIVYEAGRAALENGAKLIVIDPRRTETAVQAHLWLKPRPGTDTFLLMAMVRVIIEEGLYDRNFVEKWCHGFDRLKQKAKEFTLREAEKVTWVPAGLIRKAARLYATTRPGAIVEGMGVEQQAGAVSTIHARWILAALAGNIDVQGGDELPGPHPNYVSEREMELSDLLSPGQKAKQIGADRHRFHGWPLQAELDRLARQTWGSTAGPPIWYLGQGHAPSLFTAILTCKPNPIRALFSVGSNPMVSQADTKRVHAALRALDLYVVMDLFPTPSTTLADYVLPAASWLEKPQSYSYLGLGRSLTASQAVMPAVVEGQYHRRDEYQFWRGLGLRLGQAAHWPWETSEEMLDYRFAPLGLKFTDFAKHRVRRILNPPQYRQYERIGFATLSGKVELYSTLLEKFGYDPLPVYREEPCTPLSRPDLATQYPLTLINGGRRMEYMHSAWRQVPLIRRRYPFPQVEVHPQTCRDLGLNQGDWVWIESPRGRILQKCRPFEGIHPKVVHADFDWWYPEAEEAEPSLFGVWLSNVNLLTEDGEDVCGAEMGSWPLRQTLCRLYPARPGEVPEVLKANYGERG